MLLLRGFPFSTDIQTLDISTFSKIFSFQYGKIQNSLCKMYETSPSHIFNRLLNCDNLRMGTDLHTELSVQKMCLKMECPASCDFFGNTLLHFPSHLYGFSVLTHGIVAACTISASELCKTLV